MKFKEIRSLNKKQMDFKDREIINKLYQTKIMNLFS